MAPLKDNKHHSIRYGAEKANNFKDKLRQQPLGVTLSILYMPKQRSEQIEAAKRGANPKYWPKIKAAVSQHSMYEQEITG